MLLSGNGVVRGPATKLLGGSFSVVVSEAARRIRTDRIYGRFFRQTEGKMLPLSLLRTTQGHMMLVEVKSGETYNGQLVSCDTWMNLNLREVICTSRVCKKTLPIPRHPSSRAPGAGELRRKKSLSPSHAFFLS